MEFGEVVHHVTDVPKLTIRAMLHVKQVNLNAAPQHPPVYRTPAWQPAGTGHWLRSRFLGGLLWWLLNWHGHGKRLHLGTAGAGAAEGLDITPRDTIVFTVYHHFHFLVAGMLHIVETGHQVVQLTHWHHT